MQKLNDILVSHFPARPVAFARIVVGCLALLRALEGWRIASLVLAPETLKIPIIPGVSVPDEVLWVLMPAWIVAAFLFALGKHVKISGPVLLACMSTMLVLDEQLYSNHLYLLCLEVLLLTLASADVRSVWPRQGETVPAWPILLLQIQLSIVYLFAAITKITPTFLSGAILFMTLKKGGLFALPASLRTLSVLSVLAALAILTEIFLALALWSPRYRRAGVVVGVAFHATLTLMILPEVAAQLFIFSLAMLVIYPMFFYERRNEEAGLKTSSGRELAPFRLAEGEGAGWSSNAALTEEDRAEIRERLAQRYKIDLRP